MPKKQARLSWLHLYVAGVLVFLFAPLILVVLFSFHATPSLSFPFEGFSLRWYRDAVESTAVREALVNSVRIGVTTAAGILVVGTAAALAMSRYRFRGQTLVRTAFIAPAALPTLFLGIALLIFFTQMEVRLSLWTVTFGHLLYTLPYFYLLADARLSRFDLLLEQQAHDLGANPWQTFRRVTFPLIAPALIGGAMLVFVLSWDQFLITLFVIGNQNTLPLVIWSSVRRGIDPSINAVSAMLLAGTFIFIILLWQTLVQPKQWRS